jgi:hypothetical protein
VTRKQTRRSRVFRSLGRLKDGLFFALRVLRWLVAQLLQFLRRHHEFAESLLLGAVVSYLLAYVPIVGPFLGLGTFVTSVVIGLIRELGGALKAFNPNSNPKGNS